MTLKLVSKYNNNSISIFIYFRQMERLLKLNPQYPICIGLIIMSVGGIFFDVTSDIGLLITLLGWFIMLGGAIIGLIQRNKKPPLS